MKMRDNIMDIYKVLSADETLLRLLIYRPAHALDDPLSPDKEDILSMDNKWELIEDVLKPVPKTDDLQRQPKCRIMFYSGNRKQQSNHYLAASQDIVFDVVVHFDYEIDFRLESICDRLDELIFDKHVTGFGGGKFKSGSIITVAESYVGYRLIYTFGSVNG